MESGQHRRFQTRKRILIQKWLSRYHVSCRRQFYTQGLHSRLYSVTKVSVSYQGRMAELNWIEGVADEDFECDAC